MLTVWSAPNYCYRFKNKATVCLIKEDDNYEFVFFEADEQNLQIDNLINNELSDIEIKYFN